MDFKPKAQQYTETERLQPIVSSLLFPRPKLCFRRLKVADTGSERDEVSGMGGRRSQFKSLHGPVSPPITGRKMVAGPAALRILCAIHESLLITSLVSVGAVGRTD